MGSSVQLCTFLKWNVGNSIGYKTEKLNGREVVVEVLYVRLIFFANFRINYYGLFVRIFMIKFIIFFDCTLI